MIELTAYFCAIQGFQVSCEYEVSARIRAVSISLTLSVHNHHHFDNCPLYAPYIPRINIIDIYTNYIRNSTYDPRFSRSNQDCPTWLRIERSYWNGREEIERKEEDRKGWEWRSHGRNEWVSAGCSELAVFDGSSVSLLFVHVLLSRSIAVERGVRWNEGWSVIVW